jgi:hypothetical protein
LARVLALGCADPSLIELDVEYIRAPGRIEDLDAAIAQCDAAIANRPEDGGRLPRSLPPAIYSQVVSIGSSSARGSRRTARS